MHNSKLFPESKYNLEMAQASINAIVEKQCFNEQLYCFGELNFTLLNRCIFHGQELMGLMSLTVWHGTLY